MNGKDAYKQRSDYNVSLVSEHSPEITFQLNVNYDLHKDGKWAWTSFVYVHDEVTETEFGSADTEIEAFANVHRVIHRTLNPIESE
jgi:hypothetical protein